MRQVTKRVVAKDPKDLARLINGKKFKRAIARGWVEEEETDDNMEDESDGSDNEEQGQSADADDESEAEVTILLPLFMHRTTTTVKHTSLRRRDIT